MHDCHVSQICLNLCVSVSAGGVSVVCEILPEVCLINLLYITQYFADCTALFSPFCSSTCFSKLAWPDRRNPRTNLTIKLRYRYTYLRSLLCTCLSVKGARRRTCWITCYPAFSRMFIVWQYDIRHQLLSRPRPQRKLYAHSVGDPEI